MKKILLVIIFLLLTGCQNNNTENGTSVNANSENNDTNVSQSSNIASNLKRKIIIPLYFYDVNKWDKVAQYQNEIVIINPNNGPGDSIDANYEKLITKLNNNNDLPIGYVYTKWGSRDINEVKKDIDKWIAYYKVKGFFIDETSTNQAELDYYTKLSTYIKSKGNYYIVLNPGVFPNVGYFMIADNIVVFEDNANKLNKTVCNVESGKSSIIVYDANETKMKEIVKTYQCKNLYVTDDDLPNPYDTLPSYFDEEIKLLK